jgi:uncharacterized lipoprotein
MKKIITLICLVALLAGCAPGRWVAGNARHFQQRQEAKDGNTGNVTRR